MENKACLLPSSLLLSVFCIWFASQHVSCGNETSAVHHTVGVGVVLDLNSTVGAKANVSIYMAILDFYSKHPNYKTRLVLHTRDADDVVGAYSAVVDLVKNVRVQTIIGPQLTNQVMFAIELGRKTHVPIISFSATSPSISADESRYFIRAAQNDSSQVKGITTLIQGFNWNEVIVIYEDTEYGNGIIPYLTDAFEEANVTVPYKKAIPTFAEDSQIMSVLNKLKAMPTRVILVHTSTSTPFGSRLFRLAHKAEMMTKGYAWLITDGLSNSLDEMDAEVMEYSMEGVLGIRPYVPKSKDLENFRFRWKRLFASMNPNNTATDELNVFGLWAYDTIWALANAVEKIGPVENHFIDVKDSTNSAIDDLENFGTSEIGPRLLREMLNTKLKGMSGEFQLVNGHLQPSAFEILNVHNKGERIIGYWTPEKGFSKLALGVHYSTNISEVLKTIIWPGDSTQQPIGQDMPKKKLRIGIPMKKGFTEFVNVTNSTDTGKPEKFEGFAIDMFRAAIDKLSPKPDYEFFQTDTDIYDELLKLVINNTYDAVVGDTTIGAHRSYVDFTLPYSDSGISMVVGAKQEKSKNFWIFIAPFSWDLWLTILAASICIGFVLYLLERDANNMDPDAPPRTIDMILWLPVSSLYYAESNMVVDNRSKIVLVIWHFLMLILIQSYTANLSAILTLQSINPAITNPNRYYVGYQKGSFVKDQLLIGKLDYNESMLKAYSSPQEYHEALTKGSDNGGVAAIFDETPYIKLFMAQYCSEYMMTGPIYRTDGFGFAFPVGSPLVSNISRAILNVTQGKELDDIEQKYFHGDKSCQDRATTAASNSSSLNAYSFGGLFILSFVSIFVILAVLKLYHWKRLVAKAEHRYILSSDIPIAAQRSSSLGGRVMIDKGAIAAQRSSSLRGRVMIDKGGGI